MLIFDKSATEIDYPSNRPNSNEQGKVDEECESESFVQILSDFSQLATNNSNEQGKLAYYWV